MNKSRKGPSIDCSIRVVTVILEYFEHILAHFGAWFCLFKVGSSSPHFPPRIIIDHH